MWGWDSLLSGERRNEPAHATDTWQKKPEPQLVLQDERAMPGLLTWVPWGFKDRCTLFYAQFPRVGLVNIPGSLLDTK